MNNNPRQPSDEEKCEVKKQDNKESNVKHVCKSALKYAVIYCDCCNWLPQNDMPMEKNLHKKISNAKKYKTKGSIVTTPNACMYMCE